MGDRRQRQEGAPFRVRRPGDEERDAPSFGAGRKSISLDVSPALAMPLWLSGRIENRGDSSPVPSMSDTSRVSESNWSTIRASSNESGETKAAGFRRRNRPRNGREPFPSGKRSGRRRRTNDSQDPQAVPRRPDRPQRVGQEHVRAQAFPADRGPLVRRLPGDGQRRRERPGRHEGRLRGAPLRRRQAAGAGEADGRRRHQRPARGPQAAGGAGPAVPLPAGGDRAEPARAGLPGAEPRAARPGRSARTSSATRRRSCGGRCGGFARKASATSSSWRRPRRSRRRRSSGCRSGTTGATSTGRSTSSATSTAAATSWRSCSSGWATRRGRSRRRSPRLGARTYVHPEGRKAVFLGDLVDRGPRSPRHGAARPQHGRPAARRSACPATTT